MARKNKFSVVLTAVLAVVCLVLGAGTGFAAAAAYDALSFTSDVAPKAIVEGELQIHFLELGNKYTGDCTYIKAGDVDVLIDAGSKTSSITPISEYINQYVTDGKLEYVIVTHAHQDHYAGFTQLDGSLFDLYEVGTIIDFGEQTNQTDKGDGSNMFSRYQMELKDEIDAGAEYYSAAQCIAEEKSVFELGDSGVKMTILNSYYYTHEAESENDYSVCTLFTYGDYKYLFTGDLEEDGEEKLIELNEGVLGKVDVYKAGHHGSKTSSSEEFLAVIQPEIVCVCCCAGSAEYTDTDDNKFPTQDFIDRVAIWTNRIYVTTMYPEECDTCNIDTFQSMNGNIVVVTTAKGIDVICGSGDDRVLKEWEWFKHHREWPANGK